MKICIATLRHRVTLSGEVESLYNLIHGLREKGVEVECMTPRGKTNDFQQSFSPTKNANHILSRFFDSFNLFRLLKKHAKEYDLIQVQVPTATFCFIGDIIKLITKKKVIVLVESIVIDVPLFQVFKASLKQSFAYYLSRILLNNKYWGHLSLHIADAYIVSTSFQKEQLKKIRIDSNKIHVIPNLTKIPKHIPSKSAARSEFNIQDKFIFSFVGHFVHNKGIQIACDAFEEFQKQHKDVIFMIAFSGLGDEEFVRNKIEAYKDKARIFHMVDIPTFLQATDVILIPYVYSFATHFFPNIILESYVMGVPLISTDLNITKEIIVNEKTGLLVKSDSKEDLIQAMEKMYKNNSLRKQMIDDQTNYFKEHLRPEIIIEKFADLYRRII